jgi:hypothetical protein
MSNDAPKQIGDVVGIDRMDSLDRQKLDPYIKLQLLCAEMKEKTGRDPRGGKMSFVARPRVVLQLLLDVLAAHPVMTIGHIGEIKLHKAVILGSDDGDLVGWWREIPIRVRCTVVNDMLYVLDDGKIPNSKMIDRRQAAQLRMSAHAGKLEDLRNEEN